MSALLFDVHFLMILFDDLGEGSETVLFERVQSRAVTALLKNTRDKLTVLLAAVEEVSSSASAEGRKQLYCVGLPGSLEAHKSGTAIPESVWATVVRVQSQGGLEELKHKITDIEGSATRVVSTMDEIKSSITREETVDSVFRQRLPMVAMEPSSDQLYNSVKVHHTDNNIIIMGC